jgi:phage terminase large subunit-like protein
VGPEGNHGALLTTSNSAVVGCTTHSHPGTADPTISRQDERIYIPSRLADNPFLSADEYRASLLHLPPLERERLLNGDWGVQEAGLIQAAWLRYFVEENGQLELLAPSGQILATIPEDSCRRFVTIDPAGTSAERTREARGRTPSWTVVQVWDQPRRDLSRFLLLRHQVRVRVGFDGLCDVLRKVHQAWRPARMWIEGEKLGQAALDLLGRELPLVLLRPGGLDKVTRAAPLTLKLERGEVYLPRYQTTWRPSLEAEFLAWTGDDRQATDQIDAAAYAAIVTQNESTPVIRWNGVVQYA